jgi:hypothetical protein
LKNDLSALSGQNFCQRIPIYGKSAVSSLPQQSAKMSLWRKIYKKILLGEKTRLIHLSFDCFRLLTALITLHNIYSHWGAQKPFSWQNFSKNIILACLWH